MGYAAKILKDSITEVGCRLTTFEVTLPRIVLAEFNTHRMLSRNSASSRAIPVEKRIAAVEADPFVPEAFGKNQKGMQAEASLEGDDDTGARVDWLEAAAAACGYARKLAQRGVHKQLANRVLEPFLWHTIVVSATEWDNFFALRCHEAAQPEIRKPAEMMRELYRASEPTPRDYGDWHTPYLDDHEADFLLSNGFTRHETLLVSIGRCARVSVKTFDGLTEPRADVGLADRLQKAGHMSPFEHVACVAPVGFIGNFNGWKQYRKTIPNEHDFSLMGAT